MKGQQKSELKKDGSFQPSRSIPALQLEQAAGWILWAWSPGVFKQRQAAVLAGPRGDFCMRQNVERGDLYNVILLFHEYCSKSTCGTNPQQFKYSDEGELMASLRLFWGWFLSAQASLFSHLNHISNHGYSLVRWILFLCWVAYL